MKLVVDSTVGFAQPSTVECELQDAVGTVLNKVATDQGITDVQSVSLSYNGKILDNKKRIKDYGLRDGDSLQLVPRVVGESSPSSFYFSYPANTGFPPQLRERLAWETKLILVKKLPIKNDIYDPLHWTAIVRGSGRWRGQNSVVEIYLSKRYARKMPLIEWKTKLYPKHPNIFSETTGWVCISSLDDKNWRPTQTLASIYDDLVYVMDNPNWHHRVVQRDQAPQPRNGSLIHRIANILRG
jgi:ubiquitin-protein ligase